MLILIAVVSFLLGIAVRSLWPVWQFANKAAEIQEVADKYLVVVRYLLCAIRDQPAANPTTMMYWWKVLVTAQDSMRKSNLPIPIETETDV